MKQYEYTYITLRGKDIEPENVLEIINGLGGYGWKPFWHQERGIFSKTVIWWLWREVSQ